MQLFQRRRSDSMLVAWVRRVWIRDDNRFWYVVGRLGAPAPVANLHHPTFIFHQQPDGFATQSPKLCELSGSIVAFEGGRVRCHAWILEKSQGQRHDQERGDRGCPN